MEGRKRDAKALGNYGIVSMLRAGTIVSDG